VVPVAVPARFVIAVALLPVESTAVLPDCEIGRFALRRLSFRARKRGANQRTMNRPLVFRDRLLRLVGIADVDGFDNFDGVRLFRGLECRGQNIGSVV
jgi:hypothetical protein